MISTADDRVRYGAGRWPGGVPTRAWFRGNDFDVEIILRIVGTPPLTDDGSPNVAGVLALDVWTAAQHDATCFTSAEVVAALALVLEDCSPRVDEIQLYVHDGGTHA